MSRLISLPHRALLRFRGPDTSAFLQGLVTNDVNKLTSSKGVAAFVLNTKGRIVEDVLLWKREDEEVWVECSRQNRTNLAELFAKYKLRKKVEISETEEPIAFAPGPLGSESKGLADPRFAAFGARYFGNDVTNASENVDSYHSLRLAAGIAEGAAELEGLLPFQANADLLNMVSLDKGCYIGQELTARTAHTGVIRRRILPFECSGFVKIGSDVADDKGNNVGKVISSNGAHVLAVLSLSAFRAPLLRVDGVSLKALQPVWMPDKILANNKQRTSLTDA